MPNNGCLTLRDILMLINRQILRLTYLKDKYGAREIYTGVAFGNEKAKNLYSSIGFKETGLVEDNMEEMKYSC